MFVAILMDMLDHWFAQGAISGRLTKSVITLLKKGGRHVLEDLDDYRPIALQNTELKILACFLANRWQIVASDLIGTEQNYAVKRRSIQNNLHLVHEIIERIEDNNETALISLDQFKAYNRVDCRFLVAVLETARFEPEFRRWINILCQFPTAGVKMKWKSSRSFAIEWSVRQACSLSPLPMSLFWSPCSLGLGKSRPVLHRISLVGCLERRYLRVLMASSYLCAASWR